MGDRARAKWVEKWGGCCATFHGVGAGSPSNATSPGTRPTSVPPASCLHGHNRHGPKIGGCCAPLFGGARSHLTSRGLGRGLPPHQLAHDSCNRMSAMHMVRKVAGCCAPLLGGGKLGPHLTQCAGHNALDGVASWSIQLFGTIHQRHRHDRTGGQRSNSTGRTVLQTVAQKYYTKIVFRAQSQLGVTPVFVFQPLTR